MSQFILVLLGFLAVLVLVIVSAIRRKLRFKKRLATAWEVVNGWIAGQTVSPVYMSPFY